MPKQPAKPKGDTNIRPRWSSRLGAWVFDVTYPRWERGFRSLPEARVARNKMRADNDEGTLTRAPGRMTVSDLVMKRWLPSKKAELTNRHSLAGCIRAAELIDQGLGKHQLRKLTPLDIEEWKQTLRKRFKGGTPEQYFNRLREILKWAQDHDLINRNPAARVKPPKDAANTHKPPAFELEQVWALRDAADATPYGLLVWLAMNTTLRINELLSLTWAEVDFGARTLKTASKTEAGARTVALAQQTIERLQQHRFEQIATFRAKGLKPPENIFLNHVGTPMLASYWWWHWNKIRTAAGMPTLHFHDTRHISASLMAKAKVHPSVMKERLGHSTAAFSLDVYTHNDASSQVAAAEAVEALINGAKTEAS